MKIICYTANFGKRDPVRPKGNFLRFTDDPKEELFVNLAGENPRQAARRIKCLSHQYLPEHDWSVWFDSSLLPRLDLAGLVADVGDMLIGSFRHRDNRNWEEVAHNCARMGWDAANIIEQQVQRYKAEGTPELRDYSFETAVLVRRNCPEITDFNEMWWSEIKQGSIRDQISFPYVLWKQGIKCKRLLGNKIFSENEYFEFRHHGNSVHHRGVKMDIKML